MPYRNDTDKHIYLDADKARIVEEGSADAAFLLVGPGGEVSDADAEKYGLTKQAGKARSAADDAAEQPDADRTTAPRAERSSASAGSTAPAEAGRSVPRAAERAPADADKAK